MSTDSLMIMRLVLAAINGALFAFGAFLLYEHLYRRPKQLRRRLKELIVRADRQERLEDSGDARLSDPPASELRESVDELRKALANRKKQPPFVMNVSFGILMIALAVFSLLNLLFPSWLPFA